MQLAVAFGGAMLSGGSMMKMGLLAATAVGGFMLRKKVSDKQAGKLNDLKVSGSTYGKGIPIIWGTMRVTGNMIWSTDFEEEKHYVNSKGKDKTGKKKDDKKGTPVYEYFANFSMGLCEGPVDELLRIWADGNLIYDKYNPGGYTDSEGVFHEVVRPGFSRGESGGKGGGGGGKGGKGKGKDGDSGDWPFYFYNGSEAQMPNAFMQSKSARPCPAYRGLAHIFFRKLALKDFGNRTPTITVEVTCRRERRPDFVFFTELTAAQGGIRSWANPHIQAFVDMTRYRLYEEAYPNQNDPNCHDKNSKYLRVYDLTTAKEIAQVSYISMGTRTFFSQGFVSAANRYITSGVDTLLGISEIGDLLFRPTGLANSAPTIKVDPGSYQIYDWFGYYSDVDTHVVRWFSSDTIPLLLGAKASPLPVFAFGAGMQAVSDPKDPNSGIDHTSKTMAEYMGGTVIIGQRNSSVYVSGGNFMGYPTFSDSEDSQIPSRAAPGMPSLSGNAQFYTIEAYGGFTCRLWQHEATWIQPEFMQPAAALPEKCGVRPTLIFERLPDPTKGDYGVGISDPMTFVSTKTMGVIWNRNSYNSSRDGLWFTLFDLTNAHYPQVWEKHLPGWPLPDNFVLQQTAIINTNKIVWRAGDWIQEIDTFKQECTRWQLPAGMPQMAGGQAYWPSKGAVLHLCKDPDEGDRVKWVMGYLDKLAQTSVTVREICQDLCDDVGIDSFRVDMSQMVNDSVIGYILENPTSARSMVEDLSKVYFFDVTESDYSLKFIKRGQSSIRTIVQDELGIVATESLGGSSDSKTQEYYKETKTQEIDCPMRVDVSFVNSEKEYENGTQGYQRPRSPVGVLQTREKLDLNLPIAMNADGAKQMAQKACMSIWAERITHEFTIPWTHLDLDPTDVVTFVMDNGLTFEDRLTAIDVGADLSQQIHSVTQTAATYSSVLTGNRGGGNIPIPRPIEPMSKAAVWDIPLMFDGDADIGSFQYYWGAQAYGPGFRYAGLDVRAGTGDWHLEDGTEFDLLWGSVRGSVPVPANGPFATDDQSKITLYMGWDFSALYEWESIDDAHWPSIENAILIGDELIYFKNATINDDGRSVTIDTLIRGARGTEAAAYTHQQSETWTLVNLSGFKVHDEPIQMANQEFKFRTASAALLSPLNFVTRKTLTGKSLMPYAPNDMNRLDSTGSSTISWKRRTRIGGNLQNGTDTVPLSERFESYEAYVLPLPYDYPGVVFDPTNPATYTRKFANLLTSQFTYSATDKAADGYADTAVGGATSPHQHWRITPLAHGMNNNNRVAWADVKFGVTNNHTTGTASAGSYNNPTDANYAFDADKQTYWINYSSGDFATSWIRYSFAAPVTVHEVRVRVPSDANYKNAPLQWQVEYSDDGVHWTVAVVTPLFTAYTAGQYITLSVVPPVPEGMHVVVYQLSDAIGRGMPGYATLPPTHLT